MKHLRDALFFLLAATAACSSPPPADAGSDAAADVQPDTADAGCIVPTDAGPPANPPYLFGPCRTDADCPSGGTCLSQATDGWPGGFCTRTCTIPDDCDSGMEGVYGVCRMVGERRLCMRECLNGFGCEREGYTCVTVDPRSNPPLNICVPSCSDETCVDCMACNYWSNRCVAAGSAPPEGRDNGEPCTRSGMGSECRSGQCLLPQSTSGTYTGWNGGACYSQCSLPLGYNVGNLWGPDTFPRSNCPAGSICFPNGDGLAERDPGICLQECRRDSDCRTAEGYVCRRTFRVGRNSMRTWQNGFCQPLDCQNAPCPAGFMCEIQTRGTAPNTYQVGVCRPAVTMTDAGTDSGSDASTDASTDVSTDASTDVSTDASTDVSTDASMDVASD